VQEEGRWQLYKVLGSQPIPVPNDVSVPRGGTPLENTNWNILRQIDGILIGRESEKAER
jgi:hypothetical protein